MYLAPQHLEPPLIKPTFDGDPKKLSFFLNQIWVHLDLYAYAYSDNATMVNAMTANLEGEAAECVTNLHNEGTPQLLNTNLFMEQLRAMFEDASQALQAEKEIYCLKQVGHPEKEYVQEFQRGHWSLGTVARAIAYPPLQAGAGP